MAWLLCVYVKGNKSVIELLRGFGSEKNEEVNLEGWNVILPSLTTIQSYLPKVPFSPAKHLDFMLEIIKSLVPQLQKLSSMGNITGGLSFDETQIQEAVLLTKNNVLIGLMESIPLSDLKEYDIKQLSDSAKADNFGGNKPLPASAKHVLLFFLSFNDVKLAIPVAYHFTTVIFFSFLFFLFSEILLFRFGYRT